jgi:cytoskeletal protein CcmA (bactofilin family)
LGEEDLVIQGRVEGKVELKQNSVTIGKSGHAKADIYGKLITVEGEVEGNLFALEQVVVRSSGNLRGDISAPRVTIEDGARFKGSIDMEVKSGEKHRTGTPPEPKIVAPSPTGSSQAPKPGIYIKTEANATRS